MRLIRDGIGGEREGYEWDRVGGLSRDRDGTGQAWDRDVTGCEREGTRTEQG